MDRLRAMLAATPSAGVALVAYGLAVAAAGDPGVRDAAWEWVLIGTIFALSAAARYGQQIAQSTTVHRLRQGLCPHCGYDLRATPDVCPECGRRAAEYDARRHRAKAHGRAVGF